MRPLDFARFAASLLAALSLCCAGSGAADGAFAPPTNSSPAIRAHQAYLATKAEHDAHLEDAVSAWKFGRACFDECEFSTANSDRARVANEGIQACRQALQSVPDSAAAHYYLGMDLAQLARTKTLGALSLLDEVEFEWRTALMLDENFDYAGADRNLGLLYLRAPGWPISLGSRGNARQHLSRAVKLHPEYPENHLNLLEAAVEWRDQPLSEVESNAFVALLPAAGSRFSGPDWESSWEDWNQRWAALQKKMGEPSAASSPHARK